MDYSKNLNSCDIGIDNIIKTKSKEKNYMLLVIRMKYCLLGAIYIPQG